MPRPSPFVIGHSRALRSFSEGGSLVIPRRHQRREGRDLRSSAERSEGGFALLITVTLLAFLVLLLVSLASLTRVETQVAANTQSLAQARQNALFALNIAVGQLQKYTGPDSRVTSRADLPLPASVTITGPTYDFGSGSSGSDGITGGLYSAPGTTGAQALTAIDAYWKTSASPRNRHWTGAWKNINTTAYDRNAPAAFNPLAGNPADNSVATPAWLVSGNELTATSNTFRPTDVVTGLTSSSTPLDEIKDSANRPHRLLLKTSAGVTDPASIDRAITAPQVTLNATDVPGTDGAATPVGHYAWWIGDEGVKARANLLDPYAAITTPAAKTSRLQSAQRPAIEAMTTTGTDGLGASFPVNTPELLRVFTPDQLTYLNIAPAFPAELKSRYHDLSVSSRGVLADTRHGGLKRDLSYLLSRPSAAAFRTALNTPGYNVAPNSTYNVALTPASTPYATLPSNEASGPAYDASPGILEFGTTWEQLWSFYNLKEAPPLGVFPTGTTTASARLPTATQSGLTPLLVQAKLFYGMKVTGGAITVRITPVVVLANPYSVPLSGKFLVKFEKPDPYVVSGKLEDPALPPVLKTTNPNASLSPADPGYTKNVFMPVTNGTLSNGGLGQVYVSITATIPPGVAQIFTVDPAGPKTTITNKNDVFEVPMKNTYDPSAAITLNYGLTVRPGDTHAAFYAASMTPVLYMGNITDEPNRIGYVGLKAPASSSGAPIESGFVIYPMTSGYQNGGGVFCALHDGKSNSQQGVFSQLNYRTMVIDYLGASGNGDHPLQWGVSYGVLSQEANTAEDAYHPLLSANLLAPLEESIPATTRWGLVGNGEYPSLNTPPPELTDARTGFVNILYDVPSPDQPLASLGQLQHLNLAGYLLAGTTSSGTVKLNGFLTNYPVSNSYPSPRVRRDKVFYSSGSFSKHYDAGYLWNDLLWDRFTFSSYPQTGDFDFANPAHSLVNARYAPFRSPASVPVNDPDNFRGTFKPAEHLLVSGAFNINSTSVEAWKALFSSLKNVPVGAETVTSAPFARTLARTGRSASAANGISSDSWEGFRDISPADIQTLAEEMVLQVRLRGPFTSLSEFVNRRLIAGPADAPGNKITPANTSDPYRLGLSGALQSAIDKVINLPANVPVAPYNYRNRRNETTGPREGTGVFKGLYFADLEYRMPTRISGYPGYLLQGDVLSALGPTLTARSDTFTIRTYGDTLNPITKDVIARAWCEAVVQRTPDYVDATAPSATPVAGSAADTFGRRYQIVSFRWLTPADI